MDNKKVFKNILVYLPIIVFILFGLVLSVSGNSDWTLYPGGYNYAGGYVQDYMDYGESQLIWFGVDQTIMLDNTDWCLVSTDWDFVHTGWEISYAFAWNDDGFSLTEPVGIGDCVELGTIGEAVNYWEFRVTITKTGTGGGQYALNEIILNIPEIPAGVEETQTPTPQATQTPHYYVRKGTVQTDDLEPYGSWWAPHECEEGDERRGAIIFFGYVSGAQDVHFYSHFSMGTEVDHPQYDYYTWSDTFLTQARTQWYWASKVGSGTDLNNAYYAGGGTYDLSSWISKGTSSGATGVGIVWAGIGNEQSGTTMQVNDIEFLCYGLEQEEEPTPTPTPTITPTPIYTGRELCEEWFTFDLSTPNNEVVNFIYPADAIDLRATAQGDWVLLNFYGSNSEYLGISAGNTRNLNLAKREPGENMLCMGDCDNVLYEYIPQYCDDDFSLDGFQPIRDDNGIVISAVVNECIQINLDAFDLDSLPLLQELSNMGLAMPDISWNTSIWEICIDAYEVDQVMIGGIDFSNFISVIMGMGILIAVGMFIRR